MTTFTPVDTPTKIHLVSGAYTMSEIIRIAQRKWPTLESFDFIDMYSEHIQTRSIGYDQYDLSDYTDFIILELQDGALS